MLYRFRIRTTARNDGWFTAEGISLDDAVQTWHLQHCDLSDSKYMHQLPNGGYEKWHFLVAFDAAGERLISRVCASGIWRGSVRRIGQAPTLQALAVQMGLPQDALDGEWEGEENYPGGV
jgi:hypothetical protein